MLRALLELCRISNLPTVWTNVIAAWVIGGGRHWEGRLGWLLLGASLIYSAGMVLNDAFDVAWDREKRPERPIPSGRIGLGTAWAIGVGGLGAGYALMVFPGGAGWLITAALVGAVVLYDAYHKPWTGSVIVMGACRTLLYLAAGSSIMSENNAWSLGRLFAAGGVLGLYIIGLSLVARHEGSQVKSGKGWLWVGLLALLSPLAGELIDVVVLHSDPQAGSLRQLGFVLSRRMGRILRESMLWGYRAAFVVLTGFAVRLMRIPPPSNIGQAVGWLLAGIPLVDALAIMRDTPLLACAFVVLVPILRSWQRWIAAT